MRVAAEAVATVTGGDLAAVAVRMAEAGTR